MAPIYFLSLLLAAILFESIADISFKFSYLQHKPIYIFIGVVLYSIGTIIWAISLRYEFLSKAVSIFTIVNLVVVIMVGIFVFKEDVSLINKAGIGLGVLSVILMQI